MLDEENPTTAVDEAASEQVAPPRRRRSASRPAGPPAAVVIAPPAAEAPSEAVDALPEESTHELQTDQAQVELPTDQTAIDDPAGEAPAVDPVQPFDPERIDEAQPSAEDPSTEPPDTHAAALGEEQMTDDGLTDEEILTDEERTEEAADGAEPASSDAPPAPSPAPEDRAGQPGDVPALLELQPESPAPRRRRSTRAAKAPEPIIELVESTDFVAEQQTPLSLDELPTLDDLAPAPQPPRGRRRRVKAEPAAVADSADPIEETLGELSRTGRRGRRTKVDEVEAAKALDELVAMIGGQADDLPEGLEGDRPDPLALTETPADDADEDAEDDALDEGDDEGAEDGGPRRRRRRRGGRRRRRSGTGDAPEGESSDDEPDDDDDSAAEAPIADGEAAEAGELSASTRRRRRRRRRGEDTTGAEDDPSDVVVRVREPRRARSVNDEVTGIEGSTRMEAKRQRRRDGRSAGRRRTPILSEAEFLARRESVERTMLVRQADDYTQIGVLEDGMLVEHYVDRASAASMIGNVYLGKVQNVLPSMEAAFIDIGRGRNAVLYAGEVDWDAFGVTGGDRKMEKVLKSGQSVLVQVSKDPVGAKGARLTAHVSIPGRYVVYSPSGQLSGISRKLPEGERNRLKGILEELVGDTASVIVRTAAEGASEEELVRDVTRLKATWEVIEKKVKAGKSPEQLYAEPDLTVRIVRDLFTEDFGRLVVDGNNKADDSWDTVNAYVTHVAPHLEARLEHWNRDEQGDLFEKHRLNEQISKALERKVFLPSGGSLIIDRTEAMTVIDVNTGKFTGTSGNLEATVTSNNLEAAEEVVRQLRLRDIGGIIVIDFIDMVLPANRELLLRRLVECLGRDRTRHQVAEVTSLGLVQMTRKKIGTGLAEAFTVPCETCQGRGYHRHDSPVDSQSQADGGERDHGRRRR